MESSSDDELGYNSDDKFEDDNRTHVGDGREQKKEQVRKFLVFKLVAKAEHIYFEKDMMFTTPKQFKEAITDYAIHGGLEIRFVKNDQQRVRVVCQEGHEFVVYLTKVPRERSYQLRTLTLEHTCSRSYKNPRCTSSYIGKKLMKKGLVQTFINKWSQYEHRIRYRHLYNNFKKNHLGVLIRELFWRAAKATYKEEFDRVMDELKGIDADAHSWLDAHSTTKWAKHMFSEDALTDTIVNNMCGSFNSRILKFRSKPIISMLECIRLYLMTRFQENREKNVRYTRDWVWGHV
ncbi:uncharacterized protein LOC142639776 [Castanea sativa]|uniref:uncharacterized protein LOC142639776 n=1 Tax=Castanea sativa TaxID=21020 RepID=UPI003F64EBC5